MPDFQPFAGVHYDTTRFGADVSDLAAPPYDVIDDDRRAHLRARHAENAVHLTLPEGEGDEDRYAVAARLWRAWQESGVLVRDDAPSFYVYRVTFEDRASGTTRSTTGVIGALEVCAPGEGSVLPHERTMPKPRGDRLDLIRSTRANLEPIWGLSLTEGLTALLVTSDEPLVSCTDTRGSSHELFALTEPAQMEAVRAAVASTPVVLADGHHRYETSLHYQAERRADGAGPGAHDHIMTLIVELVADQLAVQPIHRIIAGGDPADLRRRLTESFDLTDHGPNEPDVVRELPAILAERHSMAWVDAEGVALLAARPGALDQRLADAESPLVHDVDAARFEAGVAPLVEAGGGSVTYRHDHEAVAELVRKGAVDAAVLLRPVEVPTIRAVAEAGERMPQKTTFFHPKPSTGLVFRSLDD